MLRLEGVVSADDEGTSAAGAEADVAAGAGAETVTASAAMSGLERERESVKDERTP